MDTIFFIVCAVAVMLAVYRCIVPALVKRSDATADRNPVTGILRGAEEYAIGPEDSPNAAILVHGFIGAGNNFGDLPARLAEAGWRVRVLRLPGHGASPSDLKGVDTRHLLDAVRSAVEDMRARHRFVALVGHSMGGTLSILAAASVPVDALVLAAPYFGTPRRWNFLFTPERWAVVLAPVIGWLPRLRSFVQVNNRAAVDAIVSYRWLPLEAVGFLADASQCARKPEILSSITCPVLHIHATGDRAADFALATATVRDMRNTTITSLFLTRSNHVVFWDYEAGEAVDATVRFLGACATAI